MDREFAQDKLHMIALIKLLNSRREVFFNDLAAIGAFWSQFALFEFEIALQEIKIDDALISREISIGGRDDFVKILADVFLRKASLNYRVPPVGHDQKNIVISAVAAQKAPLDSRNTLEFLALQRNLWMHPPQKLIRDS
jgi:hypothetical protein